uniref:Uncharacterized protein n=1 Tax=Rangifer tarandus platyrhynchus TaxID=3082113 RepID=A0ACB0DYJ1_RANTA|nr:unnamed protein product [Rangifer tarandus platyrhynchus]
MRGAGHPLRSTGAQPPGDMAFQPQQVSPTSCGRCGAAVLGARCSDASTPGVQHRGRAGSRVSSSTVAFHSISAFLCL